MPSNLNSADLLLYKFQEGKLNVLLVHPGGPSWKNKDLGAWSIPKGEYNENEEPLKAAVRELEEETSVKVSGNFMALTSIRQKGGKLVQAWAIETDVNADNIRSNTFEMEWPPRSGKKASFPEVDRVAWFSIEEARKKINPAQQALLDELVELLK